MRQHTCLKLIVLCWTLLMVGCQSSPAKRTMDLSPVDEITETLEQAQQQPEASVSLDEVNQALMPSLNLGGIAGSETAAASEERFHVSVNKVPAKQFFLGLVKGTPYNVVVHPDVDGSVSLDLQDVTVLEVLEVVRSIYGFSHKRMGNIFQILPNSLQTELFRVNYLNLTRSGQSETVVSAGQLSDVSDGSSAGSTGKENRGGGGEGGSVTGTTINTSSRADFWGDLSQTLKLFIGKDQGQKIIVSPQSGMVVVKALPDEIEAIREYLASAELILRRQVVIEAKILEVELSDGFQTGIKWDALAEPRPGESITFSSTNGTISNPDGIGGIFGVVADLGKGFATTIEMLERQGNVQVLSSPKISTVNNQKAVIKVGTDEFFVTEITNTTTVSGSETVNNPKIQLTPFFSGIALDVTPQISESDEIVLHIHPTVSEVQDQNKVVDLGDAGGELRLPLALSSIREADSIIAAKSGQVVVIGGLMQTRNEDLNAGVPVLKDVPVLGHLFKQKKFEAKKSELVILLRPVVIDADGWNSQLRQSNENYNQLRSLMQ